MERKMVKKQIPKKSASRRTKKVTMGIPVIVTCNEEGYFFAEVPVIRGSSEGNTREEALANLQKVVRLCLVHVAEECDTIPVEYSMDRVEVTF
jgi:predicted RNase H-like HicB family nuclease